MLDKRLFLLLIVACTPVMAQQAFTQRTVNLRAGPAPQYPLVAQLGRGMPVTVMGCINGYNWCDVSLPDGNRGWLYAQSINYFYRGRPVSLLRYRSTIGLPIINFNIGSYWGHHYRDRPWFQQHGTIAGGGYGPGRHPRPSGQGHHHHSHDHH